MNQIKSKDENIKDNEFDASWLLRIPDELKLEVFKNLPPKDLISVSETCVELHSFIQEPRLWTELTVDLSETRRALIWKVARCPWVNTLIITNKTGLNAIRHKDKISNISRRIPRLKIIYFGFKVDDQLLASMSASEVNILVVG